MKRLTFLFLSLFVFSSFCVNEPDVEIIDMGRYRYNIIIPTSEPLYIRVYNQKLKRYIGRSFKGAVRGDKCYLYIDLKHGDFYNYNVEDLEIAVVHPKSGVIFKFNPNQTK